MPLTKEQFQKAREAGYTIEQIAEFEKRRVGEQTQQPQSQLQMEKQNILGMLGNVPSAAIRSTLQGKGFTQGAIQPSSVPSFQQLALENPNLNPEAASTSVFKNFMLGLPASTIGFAADVATDPATLLMTLIGGLGSQTKIAKAPRSLKIDNNLNQSIKAKNALDNLRNTLGKAKELAIQEVKDVPAELNFKGNMSKKVIEAIQNPIYGVEFTQEGGVKGTVGNLDKVKEAVGELISSPKIWEEAPKAELRWVKQFYGQITQSMKEAATKAGKPITEALDSYHQFMKRYYLVNKTLVDTVGTNLANKMKSAFKIGAEPAVKEAWKEVSKASPEIKQVMNTMNRRELLKQLLKYSGIGVGLGLAGKGVLSLKD